MDECVMVDCRYKEPIGIESVLQILETLNAIRAALEKALDHTGVLASWLKEATTCCATCKHWDSQDQVAQWTSECKSEHKGWCTKNGNKEYLTGEYRICAEYKRKEKTIQRLSVSSIPFEDGTPEQIADSLDALADQHPSAAEKLRVLAKMVRELDESLKNWIEIAMRAGEKAAQTDRGTDDLRRN